jgi:IS1 family transposase
MDADTKLVPCWMVGPRDATTAHEFMTDLSDRLVHRVQLTTDGYHSYLNAVESAFGHDIDYAMLVKIYGADPTRGPERKYSPENFCGIKIKKVSGDPRRGDISTSFIERQNLTMRMSMRRMTRLTNGFSKKLENLGYAVALHFMYYNFGRIHQTLRVTPAMAAGVSDHVWELEEIAALQA